MAKSSSMVFIERAYGKTLRADEFCFVRDFFDSLSILSLFNKRLFKGRK